MKLFISKTLTLIISRLMERLKSLKKCKNFSWWTSKLISNIQQPTMCYTLTQRSQWLHVKILPMCVSTVTLSPHLFSSSPLSLLSSSDCVHYCRTLRIKCVHMSKVTPFRLVNLNLGGDRRAPRGRPTVTALWRPLKISTSNCRKELTSLYGFSSLITSQSGWLIYFLFLFINVCHLVTVVILWPRI